MDEEKESWKGTSVIHGIVRRATWKSDMEASIGLDDDPLLGQAKDGFKSVIRTTGSIEDTTLDTCFDFYCELLENRFKTVNESHFAPCLNGSTNGPLSSVLNKVVMYQLLTSMAKLAFSKDNLTLQDMIDQQNQLQRDYEPTSHLLVQLVFMAFGWLTMLYDPYSMPSVDKLQISEHARLSQQASRLKTEALHTFEQDFNQVQQPLINLFYGFGEILPPFDSRTPSRLVNHSEYLILSYLSYCTLTEVAKIKIQWVESLNLHLEFDEGARVLKLFRYPSFCRLMYREDEEGSILDRLFAEGPNEPEPRQLFREILLSYRLLFGQNKRSWKLFNASYKNVEGIARDGKEPCDPLLVKLCGRPWKQERSLYGAIDANDAPNHYSASRDFPFFGDRLSRLQHFSEVQNPSDWKVLRHDKRDIKWYYTFWAVFVFGGGNLLIALFQLVVQAVFSYLQVAAAKDQVALQRASNILQEQSMGMLAPHR